MRLQVSVKGRDIDGYYELSLFKTRPAQRLEQP
jgi:hypothetical protein